MRYGLWQSTYNSWAPRPGVPPEAIRYELWVVVAQLLGPSTVSAQYKERFVDSQRTYINIKQPLLRFGAAVSLSCLAPGSANVVCGWSIAFKSAGSQRLVKDPVAMKAAMGINPKGCYAAKKMAPMTRMAIAESETDLSQVFTIEVFDADSAAAAQCVQADLAAIGIQTEIVEEEIGTWFDNLMAGNMDLSIVAMGTDMVGVEDMLSMFDPVAGYPFPISDELLEMVRSAPLVQDDDARFTEVVKTLNMLAEECLWVPLFGAPMYYAPMYYAYNSNVQGLLNASAATCVFYVGDMSFAE